MANRRFIDFPIASTVGDSDIILIWQSGANKQTTKATFLSGLPENLDELNDVAISGLTNGQILRYDSVTGKWENTDQGNLDLNDLNDVSIVSPSNGQVLVYNSSTSKWENSSGGYVPYTGAVTTVNLGAQTIQAGQFVKAGGTSSQFLKADGSVDSTAYGTGSVTSVALTMPSAFSVANSPITTTGTLAVTGAGNVGQYIRGDGSLADFPQASGGGSSVSYYLNGSISQGTIGGVAYKELNKVPILGAGTDFTINADGYIASFLTDAGDPNLLEIPGGNWNFETYFSASSSGGSPSFYVELYKYDGTTFTLIASSSSSPELIAFGTNLNPYFSTLAVPTTTLALTDRLAIRYYVTHSGRTITLHTENNHLCQVVTTFTTGLTSLNGLTAQVQNLAVGTSGTDFNIASATATHTFNLPTASATNRGALSSADWTTFNNKTSNLGTVTSVGLSSATSGVTIGSTPITTSGTITLAIATASGSQNGLLSSTDWTTFNNKQNALTNPVTGTGVSGRVAYWNGTNSITSDADLLFDGSNLTVGGNVLVGSNQIIGINTADASDTGYLAICGASSDGPDRAGHIYLSGNERGTDAGSVVIAGGNTTTGTGATAAIVFRTLGTDKARLTSAGNFGLGTDTPVTFGTRNLDVNGGAGSAYIVARGSNNTGTIEIAFDGSGYIGTKTAHDLVIRTSDIQRINVFATSGNVLVGTGSDAGYKLDVNGTGRFSDGTQGLIIRAYTGTDGWGAIYPVGVTPNTSNYTLIAKSTNAVLNASTSVTLAVGDSGKLTANSTGISVIGVATLTGPALPITIASTNSTELYTEYRYNTSTVVGYIGNGAGIVTGSSSSDFGIRAQADLILASGGNNRRVTITSGGNVLIGTTTDGGRKLEIQTSSTNAALWVQTGGTTSSYTIADFRTGTNLPALQILGNGNSIFNAKVLVNESAISPQGEQFAVTATNLAAMFKTTGGAGNNWAANFWNNATSGNNIFIEFGTETSYAGRGSVTYNRGAGLVTYNTMSDYRLKTEIQDFDALTIIQNLKPKKFKIGDATQKSIGFIAHELQEFYPQAVHGEKDATDANKKPIYQGVDYSQLTGLLVKAIQELKQEIDTLKN